MMKAINVDPTTHQASLGQAPRPPSPPPKTLLVRVAYTALNRADTLQRKGLYPPPPGASNILGLELSGVIEETGPDCVCDPSWKKGDRVAALVTGGSYAEFCLVEESLAMRVPAEMPLQLAASIPEAFLTAYQLLYFVGHFQKGEKVLIHAGASGVGHAAIQLVQEMGGLPIVTASGGKLALLRERLGLTEEQTIDYTQGSFVEKVKQATTSATTDGGSGGGAAGVDIVLCCVGANYFQDNLEVLASGGRLVLYGTMSGSVVPSPLDLRVVMKKGLTIRGTTLRARPLAYKKALVEGLWTEERVGKFVRGEMKSVIYRSFGWEEVGEAHAMMERNENVGKILLSVDGSLK